MNDDYLVEEFEKYSAIRELGDRITGAKSFDRFAAIRDFYRHVSPVIMDTPSHVWACDPYAADWGRIFTPIEFGIWIDIRACGAVLYPQYPIGRYFVDFGHPREKVCIECDGAEWHKDAGKDADRQRAIEAEGWIVYRVPGWKCLEPDERLDKETRTWVPNPSRVGPWILDIALRHGLIRASRHA